MDLGNAIKLCRVEKGLSQTELARLAGLSVSYVALIEQNKRDPNFSVVKKLSRALAVPVPLLIFLAEDKDKIAGISPELAEKLSAEVLKLIKASAHE